MYCQNKIVHVVQDGDSLYKLSRQYGTTVTELILGNPGVNPYNLQIGMRLNVCPGPGYQQNVQELENNSASTDESSNSNGAQENETETESQSNLTVADLLADMGLVWLDQIFWTRMYLMSVDADAADQNPVEERLLQTADEITDVFAKYLPLQITRQLRNLLMEHIEMTAEIIRMLKSGNMTNYDELIKNWYANANQIAVVLGNANPYFAGRETRNVLLNHLDRTREEIEHQINGEYAQSIETFRDLEQQTLNMAEYFARGLLAR